MGTLKGFGGMVGIEWKESAVHEKVGKYGVWQVNARHLN